MLDTQAYQALIHDAEHRIGSYIAGGGSSEDKYVKDQVSKIRAWAAEVSSR